MLSYLQVVIQPKLCEFILQMDSEVHVLHWVDHNVNELHASDLDNKCKQTLYLALTCDFYNNDMIMISKPWTLAFTPGIKMFLPDIDGILIPGGSCVLDPIKCICRNRWTHTKKYTFMCSTMLVLPWSRCFPPHCGRIPSVAQSDASLYKPEIEKVHHLFCVSFTLRLWFTNIFKSQKGGVQNKCIFKHKVHLI